MTKRKFDLLVAALAALAWAPVLVLCALAILLLDGRPVFYVSQRRVGNAVRRVPKFRTMCRDAERLCNRDTVPVSNNVRFLNTPIDSPLYTPIGRRIERFALTELPQVLLVLQGRMSLVGNRPLPENVVHKLKESYSNVDDRFLTPAGMTGPVQLVGRMELSDVERLDLEGAYCRLASEAYSWELDFMLLLYTVLICLHLKQPLTPTEVNRLMINAAARAPRRSRYAHRTS